MASALDWRPTTPSALRTRSTRRSFATRPNLLREVTNISPEPRTSMSWSSIAVLLFVGVVAVGLAIRASRNSAQSSRPALRASAVEKINRPLSIASGVVPAAPAVSQPDDLVTRLEREIFTAAAARMPDPDLQRQYAEINEKFFQNALAPVSVLWEPRLREIGPLKDPDLVFEGLTDGHTILLTVSLRGDEDKTRAVLC